jgi:hypothetical protein
MTSAQPASGARLDAEAAEGRDVIRHLIWDVDGALFDNAAASNLGAPGESTPAPDAGQR